MPENPFAAFLMGLANPGVPQELWTQIRSWFRRLLTALPNEALPRKKPQYCEHVSRRGNGCEHMAVLECRACGEAICLEHAYIGMGAKAICMQCVSAIASAAKTEEDDAPPPRKKQSKRKRSWTREEKPHDDEVSELEELRAAYQMLRLDFGASEDAIKARFRELSRTEHPDRFTDLKEKAVAELRFKQLSAAYTLLMNRAAAA